MSKYEVISGPYFPVFSPNTGKYGPEITPYLDFFHVVSTTHKNNTDTLFMRNFKLQPQCLQKSPSSIRGSQKSKHKGM